jgi:nucleotide-binding universal stress UspA family protein
VPKGRVKALIPASGGSNAILAVHLAAGLCSTEGDSTTALYVETGRPGLLRRLMFWRRRFPLDLEEYMVQLKAAAKGAVMPLAIRQVDVEGSVRNTILAEVKRGYQFLFLGASNQAHPIYQPLISQMIAEEPCHAVIVRGRKDLGLPELPLKRLLVPTDGSYYSDAAFQFAAAYAERTGARVTVAYVARSRELNPLLPSGSEADPEAMFQALRKQLAGKIRPDLLEVKVLEGASVAAALAEEVAAGGHDLAVIGAENKSIVERVYVGQTVEAALEQIPCAIAVVIPKVAGR